MRNKRPEGCVSNFQKKLIQSLGKRSRSLVGLSWDPKVEMTNNLDLQQIYQPLELKKFPIKSENKVKQTLNKA